MATTRKAETDDEKAARLVKERAESRDRELKARGYGAPIGERLPIEKWKVGLVVMGRLLTKKKLPDQDDRKGGHIFTMALDDDSRVCYGAPTILWDILEPVELGTELHILCTGKVPSRRGQDAWAFEVRQKS